MQNVLKIFNVFINLYQCYVQNDTNIFIWSLCLRSNLQVSVYRLCELTFDTAIGHALYVSDDTSVLQYLFTTPTALPKLT